MRVCMHGFVLCQYLRLRRPNPVLPNSKTPCIPYAMPSFLVSIHSEKLALPHGRQEEGFKSVSVSTFLICSHAVVSTVNPPAHLKYNACH